VKIREGTRDDHRLMEMLIHELIDELWQRPFEPLPIPEGHFDDKLILVAEADGDVLGGAYGYTQANRTAHLHLVYVRPEHRGAGVGTALMREFAQRVRPEVDHVTLDVDTTNESGREFWRRLGFGEFAVRLSAPLDALEGRLAAPGGPSRASIHVQTDDARAVEQAVRKYVPRLARSEGSVVAPPRKGWVAVYDERADYDVKLLRRLSAELSHATGAVVAALALESGAVVRYLLVDRGALVDEYLSVPEFHGPLPPGDAIALSANATVVSRLTGADPGRVREIARTARSPSELPPAEELLEQIGGLLGLEGAGLGYDGAAAVEGATRIEHR
jgi:ribosomal protein S18 acetylase RimI-like enzyme